MNEKNNVCDRAKKNRGVACNVCNCVYNDGERHCTAEKISVGPSYAKSCADTVCATFTAESEG